MKVPFFLSLFALCLPNMLLHAADQGLLAAFQILNISRDQGIYERHRAQLNRDTVDKPVDQKRSETPFSSASSSPMASPQTVRWPSLQPQGAVRAADYFVKLLEARKKVDREYTQRQTGPYHIKKPAHYYVTECDIIPPRVTVEASPTLEFFDNADALYEYNGREDILTASHISGPPYGPIYFEYLRDEKKSYYIPDSDVLKDGNPAWGFDDSTAWAVVPQSDLRAYRLASGYQAFKFEGNKISWRSPILPVTQQKYQVPEGCGPKLYTHKNLPYCALQEVDGVKCYSTTFFTSPTGTVSDPEFTIKLDLPTVTWHPTDAKLLVAGSKQPGAVRVIEEYNMGTKTVERKFLRGDTLLGSNFTYVPDVQKIVGIGGQPSILYELIENEQPRQMPLHFVDGPYKDIWCRKILAAVKNYLIIECYFDDNPRFLGIYNISTGNLYNVHNFVAQKGSLLFDPNTFKIFSVGLRPYFDFDVYNRECQILKVELGE